MSKNQKPNIIFILSDQQRWDTVGCYGNPPIKNLTPNLDKMAKEGVAFSNAFTCQPVCGPTRACLQTGRYPTEIGCHTNNRHLPLDEDTIAKILSRNGYEVGYIGKWHLASTGRTGSPDNFQTKPIPLERRGGYTDYWLASDLLEFTSHSYDGHMFDKDNNRRDFPEGRYRVDVLTDWTIECLQTRTGEKPFFLFLSYLEPHHQNDRDRYEGPHGSKEKFGDYKIPGDLKGKSGDWKKNLPDYFGCIHSLDQNLGRIRRVLEGLGMSDNTLIIYTSDHGSHFWTRNREYKRSCHDSCTHIPMIFYGPNFKNGKVIDELVSLIDIPPTILYQAGLNSPDSFRGRVLHGLLEGKPKDWREEVFIQISESQCGRAIRTKKFLYSVRAPNKRGSDPASNLYEEDYLYDNDVDPHQRNNLVVSNNYVEVRKELSRRLIKRIEEAEGIRVKIIPEKKSIWPWRRPEY